MRLYSGERPRYALHLEPGRLHADLPLLLHRYAEARPQSHVAGDRRADHRRAGAARRFPRIDAADERLVATRRDAADHQYRLHGHGRAALIISTMCAMLSACSPMATASRCRSGASRFRPPASCRRSSGSARKPAQCSPSRCMRCATICATRSCRSTRNIRSRNCSPPAAAIPGASNARRVTFEYVMLKGVNDSPARGARTGAALERHTGEDQPDPIQSLARHALRMLGLGEDRAFFRHRLQRRLCESRTHARRGRDILAACAS